MNRERSVHFSGKPRQKWLGIGALGAVGVAGMVALGAGHAVTADVAPARGAPSQAAPPRSALIKETASRPSADSAGPRRAHRKSSGEPRADTPRPTAERPVSEARARLVASAERELAALEVQAPENFLAVFDMMREEEPGREKTLEAGRAASHAYILARMRILARMLRRFIDDPESDHALESAALSELDADFKRTIDSLTRDVPAMADVQAILTTTTLKAPSFLHPGPEEE